ncbi:oleate hydratase [Macrococcoides bohemicum]|uniref:oleate hydratase n=1 Tax=Macrococcoides bohemicum TaxID=1903056 RepID=UPI00193EF543|nr:oleate hydratase [Macrococcus bohemicus]QRN49282.1 oleate hydratase [Macrococcus bohemicus]
MKTIVECTGKEICEEWLYHMGVPEVFGSVYDIRILLHAISVLNNGKKLEELDMPFYEKIVEKRRIKKVKDTFIEELLEEAKLI